MPPKKTLLGLATGINESKDLPELTSGNFMEDMSRLNSFMNPQLAENVEAPGLGLLEYAETGPLMLMKGMGSLISKSDDIAIMAKKIMVESQELMFKSENFTKLIDNYKILGEDNVPVHLLDEDFKVKEMLRRNLDILEQLGVQDDISTAIRASRGEILK
jgi:hypothetical protein